MNHTVKVRRILYERAFESDENGSSAQVRTTEEKNVGDDNWKRRAFFQFHSKVETPEGNKITRVFEYPFTNKIAEGIKAAINELWDHISNEEPSVMSRKREYEMKIDGGFMVTMKSPAGIATPPSYHLTHSDGGNYSTKDIKEFCSAIALVNVT